MFAHAKGATLLPHPAFGTRPLTTGERLGDIERLLEVINGYAEFVCRAGSLQGSSPEAKEKAIAAFHDRMVLLERQLGRINEELRLG